MLQPGHAFGAEDYGVGPHLLRHGEDRLLGSAKDDQFLALYAGLLRQRPHPAGSLPAVLREPFDELAVVDARMESQVLVDDVEGEELHPESTGQPGGVLAGAQGDFRAVRGDEYRRSFMGSGFPAFETSGLRSRVRSGGDQDRPPRLAQDLIQRLAN